VLDEGCVVERGTHPVPIAARGRCWELLRRQEAEEELELTALRASSGACYSVTVIVPTNAGLVAGGWSEQWNPYTPAVLKVNEKAPPATTMP
jgi:hypothetical protein